MKKQGFFENAAVLNERFGIVPLMYGSLGLAYITEEALAVDDVDLLIPSVFLNDQWALFKAALFEYGYLLVDEREHTFEKNGICYSYASLEELPSFAGIDLSELKEKKELGVSFRVLSLEQYLKVYTASSKDGYRINVRKKKDAEKIALIQSRLP